MEIKQLKLDMAANMYRVGDYVYFETSSTAPYQIRRIEELNKTPNGNVEAKVMCFYRRRDISSSLIMLADKHQSSLEEDQEEEENINEKQRHQLKHRELFLSRQVETLPATHIRGKCVVTLLNETESLASYLQKEDTYFYSLVYDPQQKTLLADKGEIRVGSRFQADVQSKLKEGEEDGRNLEELEELVWSPSPDNGLQDKQIDQFLVIARSVGTFARALDCSSTIRQPSLHMSAAAASRDITLYHAMDSLHKNAYQLDKAIASLVPSSGPVLCRDEMEEWSASEANLFEEALDKYGKDFTDIRQDFLPWKTLKSIVEYYYMWKTTDRYVQQKRIKAAEAESKLKQVYIPNYNKPNPAAITNPKGSDLLSSGKSCESCFATATSQWYAWGPLHMQCRLCAQCWTYWKKCGGLKMPTRLDYNFAVERDLSVAPSSKERLAAMAAIRMHKCTIQGCGKEFKLKAHLARHLATVHGLAVRSGSPRPVMKTRAAFCLITTPLTKLSRRVCRHMLNIQHAARNPFQPINIAAIKQECQIRVNGVKSLDPMKEKTRDPMETVLARLGIDTKQSKPALLKRAENGTSANHQKPGSGPYSARPPGLPPPKFPGQVEKEKEKEKEKSREMAETNNHTVSSNADLRVPTVHPSIMKKRGYEQTNGVEEGPVAKRPTMGVIRQTGKPHQVQAQVPAHNNPAQNCVSMNHHVNGRGNKNGSQIRAGPRKYNSANCSDAPDDVFFLATDKTKKLRKVLSNQQFRSAARKPWKGIKSIAGMPTAISIGQKSREPPVGGE